MQDKKTSVQTHQGITDLLDDMRAHLRTVTLADVFDARVAGFALLLAWQLVVYFSNTIHFSTRNDVSHFNSVLGFSSLGMVAVFLFAVIVPRWYLRGVGKRSLRWAAPLLVAAASVMLAVVEHSEVIRQPWCSIASAAAGVGMGALFLGWGVEFSRLTTIQVIAKASAGFVAAALLFAVIVLLPEAAAIPLTVLLPLGSGAILFGFLGIWREPEAPPDTFLRHGAFSLSSVFSLGVLAMSGAFVSALFMDASPIANSGSHPWILLVASLVAVIAVCAPMLSADSFDFAAAYKTSVFVMGFMFLLLPIVPLGGGLAHFLGMAIYCITILLTWVVLARITGLYRLAPLFTFGVGWSSLVVGSLVGTFAGGLLGTFMDVTPRLLSECVLVCLCLLFFAYLFLFTEKSMARLLGGPLSRGKRPFRERCHQIALDYALTEREEEVMMLIAKGRSTPRIREELGLTTGTVNTHLANLYRKLDVHDRQEVIDLVEKGRNSEGE